MARAFLTATVSLLLCPVPAAAQPPAPDARSGLIVGRVVEAGSDRGVRGAIVTLVSSALVGRVGPPSGSVGGSAVSSLRVSTTSDGSFVFRGLPHGDYGITATKAGYVPGAYGRRRPDGPTSQLTLGEGEKVGDVSVPMWRLSAITGTVTDERGEPIVGIELQALLRTMLGGRRRFTRTVPVTTDDRGIYRFAALPPGDYVVSAMSTQVSVPVSMLEAYRDLVGVSSSDRTKMLMPIFDIGGTTSLPGTPRTIQAGPVARSVGGGMPPPPDTRGRQFVYQTTFYPSSPLAAQATVITTASGEERTGIDIQLRPVATSQVSGVVTGPEEAVGAVAVRLLPTGADPSTDMETVAATLTDRDGTFTFPAVPPGSYRLRASQRPPSTSMGTPTVVQVGGMAYATSISTPEVPSGPPPPTWWAEEPLAVGRNPVSDLVIPLRPGIPVSGHVQFDGVQQPTPAPQALARLVIGLDSIYGTTQRMLPPEGRVGKEGQFEIPGVEAGRYVVRITGVPPGWTIRGVTSGGRELSDLPLVLDKEPASLVVSLTDRPGELGGVVHAKDGSPDAGATVILFPTDTQLWTADWRSPLRFRASRTRRDGAYRFVAPPPGDYFLIAIPDVAAGDWQDIPFLEGLARQATRVKIADGDKRTQNLQTAEVR